MCRALLCGWKGRQSSTHDIDDAPLIAAVGVQAVGEEDTNHRVGILVVNPQIRPKGLGPIRTLIAKVIHQQLCNFIPLQLSPDRPSS